VADHAAHNALAQRARTDDQAFSELYELYLDPIYGFVLKRVGHVQTAEDLTSDIFHKVFLHLESFNPTKASFRTWIYQIATNRMIDYWRTEGKRKTQAIEDLQIPNAQDNPARAMMEEEEKRRIQSLLTILPEKQQQAVSLKYFSELSYEEIAGVMKISPNNVGVLLHRALKTLSTKLSHES
jgi:RNA polymerase sigma-70 factor (ECF subfamily)